MFDSNCRPQPGEEDLVTPEKLKLKFWEEFLAAASSDTVDDDSKRFPILIKEPSNDYTEHYVTVNISTEDDHESELSIENLEGMYYFRDLLRSGAANLLRVRKAVSPLLDFVA